MLHFQFYDCIFLCTYALVNVWKNVLPGVRQQCSKSAMQIFSHIPAESDINSYPILKSSAGK